MQASGEERDRAKLAAAAQAVELVQAGMRLGLGTGSTAAHFLRGLAERAERERLGLVCVATSVATAELAERLGLDLRDLDAVGRLDMTIDGADEIDGAMRLIKGGGAALLREKIVAHASDRMVVIADEGKRVPVLGAFPLPVEVVRFGWQATRRAVEAVIADADVDGREVTLRMVGQVPLVTDEGNHILDLHLERIRDPERLAARLVEIPGVVETGLFLGMADGVILGRADGSCARVGGTGEAGLDEREARAWAEELTRSIEA
jgi:ribose 5-phosphate isomerase A